MISNIYQKFITKYGIKEFYFTLLYPLILPVLMVRDTGISLLNIVTALQHYNWKYLTANDPQNGYNNFFYYLQDLAVQESGRYGITPYFNGGEFPLSKLFHLTPVSLRFQASFGTVFMMFFAMCMWLASWVVLYGASWFVIGILAIVLFSTLFYACFIEIQNYNILGWMLYPFFFYALSQGDAVLTAGILFLISLLSFTAMVLAIPYTMVYAYSEPWLLVALIPALTKIMIPLIRSGQWRETIAIINGGTKVKYSRGKHKAITIRKVYIAFMVAQYTVVYSYVVGLNGIALLLAGTVLFFLINEMVMRIADQQSFYILYLSIGVFSLLNTPLGIWLFISFGFSIYLIYGLLINVRAQTFLTPGIRFPFNALPDIEKLQSFLSIVPKGEKIIMAYRNPERQYGQIFNGYRIYNEPIQYAAALNGLSYLPDWYTIFSNNKEDSPEDFWIDTIEKANLYMAEHRINHVLIPEWISYNTNNHFLKKISDYTFIVGKVDYTISLYRFFNQDNTKINSKIL